MCHRVTRAGWATTPAPGPWTAAARTVLTNSGVLAWIGFFAAVSAVLAVFG